MESRAKGTLTVPLSHSDDRTPLLFQRRNVPDRNGKYGQGRNVLKGMWLGIPSYSKDGICLIKHRQSIQPCRTSAEL